MSSRQSHAALDLSSRRKKALKIERLLDLAPRPSPVRLLEIGTGSGGIAHYFATQCSVDCEVTAVDIVDQRVVGDGYEFQLVKDTALPFDDASFDVILTNHVIEHVGDSGAQLAHLNEVRRVMAPHGIGYLAVPNRWKLVEPHYQLAFLSWLPHSWRSPYLSVMGRGERYDCKPLRLSELDSLLDRAEFHYSHLEVEALRHTIDIEDPASLAARMAGRLPDRLLSFLRPVIPTLICRLELSRRNGGDVFR